MLLAAGAALAIAACRRSDPLRDPRPARVAATAPDSFVVLFETSRGPVTVMVNRELAPYGADRVHYLVTNGFYDGARFFRAIRNFVVQFGIPADPGVAVAWEKRTIPDDPVRTSNARGTVTFAHGGRDTRTTQLFINLRDNARLDTLRPAGFAPIGRVTSGMAVVDSIHTGYGGGPDGPSQDSIRLQGNAYLDRKFPRLDFIRSARIVASWPARR